MSLGDKVASAWYDVMEEWEEPLGGSIFFRPFDAPAWYPYPTYRDWVNRRRVNVMGHVIPQIKIVKKNLRTLKAGNTMTWRGLNVQDRRRGGDRRRR